MRDVLTVLAVAVAVLLVGVLGYSLLFGGDELQALSVQRVDGQVRTERAGREEPTSIGELLGPGDRLIAGEGGRAVLSFGEASALVVESETSLRVLGEGDEGIEIELEGGRVHATVRPGDGGLGVRNGDRRVGLDEAEADIAIGPDGSAYVEVVDGDLELSGFDGVEALRSGQRLVAAPGAAALVEGVDKDLLLDVAWPEARSTNQDTVLVRGTSAPGSRVRVSGGVQDVRGQVDSQGDFELRVPLGEGDNALRVAVVDPLGREREASWEVLRDTRPPTATIQVGGP